jgi:hypothetical protein
MRALEPTMNDDIAAMETANPQTDGLRALRRCVLALGVITLFYAGACGVGLLLGMEAYKYASTYPELLPQGAARVLLLRLVERGMLAICFVALGRALLRYASALKRASGVEHLTDPAALLPMQTNCWQWAAVVALLYTGWEITAAVVDAMQRS